MRYPRLACLAAISFVALAPSFASAQDINGSGSPMADLQDLNRFATRGFMNQWSATRPARLSGLSPAGKKWLKAQVARQAVSPRSPIEVAVDVDQALPGDIKELAREQGVRPQDVSRALVLKVMIDTKNALSVAAWQSHHVAPKGTPGWDERIAQAEANRRAAVTMQSDVSMALAMD
jgi:hypothetical protein